MRLHVSFVTACPDKQARNHPTIVSSPEQSAGSKRGDFSVVNVASGSHTVVKIKRPEQTTADICA